MKPTVKAHMSALAVQALLLAAAVPMSADISGVVFRDLPVNKTDKNTYGLKDSNELGVEGVTVTAYAADGSQAATATTAADGSYTLSTGAGDYRIEFSTWPSYLEESPQASDSKSSVQFVSDGTANAHFALHDPDDYSDTATPDYVTNVLIGGNGKNDMMNLVTNHYTDTGLNSDYKDYDGNDGTGPNPTVLIKQTDMGTVWGLGIDKIHQRIYVSSLLKRHSGFADGNPSRIWYVDYGTSPASVHYFDLQDVAGIDLGAVDRTGDNALADDPTQPSQDNDAYAKIGKTAYGDLEYDNKTGTIWAVNLNQRAIIAIDASGVDGNSVEAAKVHQYTLDELHAPDCQGGTLRPWGLSLHHGKGYLGAVCDASSSQNAADLHAYVLSFDLDSPSSLSMVVDFALGYDRSGDDGYAENDTFFPWTDVAQDTSNNWDGYNQPILSDIEFDEHNNMYLAFLDRWGLQIGYKNYALNSTDTSEDAYGQGEMRKVCLIDNVYKVEGSDAACPHLHTNDYFDDKGGDNNANPDGGSYALLKGKGELLRVYNDAHPADETGRTYWKTNGVQTFDLSDGTITNWYSINSSNNDDTRTAYTGKAAGMGDLELLTAPSPIEIGNRIWKDENKNGIQDAGEKGIEGVTVQLYDANGDTKLAEVSTSADGVYIFSNDPTGTSDPQHGYAYAIGALVPRTAYTIKIPDIDGANQQASLQNLVMTQSDANSNGNDTIDSDCTLDQGDDTNAWIRTQSTDLSMIGDNNHSFDCGFYEVTAEIDIEKYTNNIQADTADTAVLLERNDAITWTYVVKNTGNEPLKNIHVTDDQGVTVTCPATTLDAGGEMNCTATGTATVGEYENKGTVTAEGNNSGEQVNDEDLSHYKLYGALCGNVAKDTDNDDAGDMNLEGVTLTLKDASGTAVGTTKTNASGDYCFSGLSPAEYTVVETQPAGLLDVTENEGGDDNDKPDDGVTNSIAAVVDAGETDTGNDFVEEEPGSLCGNVAKDTDNDDAGDVNLEGVTLTLKDASGTAVGTTETNASGDYCFSGLSPAEYTVVETQPAGLLDVTENEGGDDNDKPDDGVTNSIAAVIDAGETDTGNDFVEEKAGAICGKVGEDTNNDDIAEKPISDVTLTLKDNAGNPIRTTATKTDGSYCFNDLYPGEYTVVETQPEGYFDVTENEGGDDNDKPDDGVTNSIAAVIDAGETDTGNDFVEEHLGSLCGYVLIDSDNDDKGDKPLPGVTLALQDTAGNTLATTQTASDGKYCFDNLAPGDYRVVEKQPADYIDVTEYDGGDDNDKPDNGIPNAIDATVDVNEVDIGNTFVEEKPQTAYRIGDLFWIDDNDNGKYDPGEKTVGNAKVELLDEDGNVLATTKTDENGRYHFDVPKGKYKVRFYIPDDLLKDGYSFVPIQKPGDDTNKANTAGMIETAVEVGPGIAASNLTLDAAIQCPCANIISNSVDAFSRFALILLIFFTLMMGMAANRKETL